MKQNHASRTAEYMALFRALESLRPSGVRLCDDPFAQSFLAPSLRTVIRLAGLPVLRETITWWIDRKWPGARASGIVRTRFIDEVIAKALKDGMEQVVILGAGFDCRAYRIPEIAGIRVYEVDHPATLAAKKERLQQTLNSLPPHVTFVAIDFNQQRLADVLAANQFDASPRTL